MDGLISTVAMVDGQDATQKIADMVMNSRFYSQIQIMLLDGIAVGGFNVIDVYKLNSLTRIPIIIVMRHLPDHDRMFSAMRKLDMHDKISMISKLPKPEKIGKIFIQRIGIQKQDASLIVEMTCTRSIIPEPLRQAHIIASGIVRGESYGGS